MRGLVLTLGLAVLIGSLPIGAVAVAADSVDDYAQGAVARVAAKAEAAGKALVGKKKKKDKKKKFADWDEVIEDTKKIEGLFPLYYNKKDQKLFMEIGSGQYNKELILPISIARGAGWLYMGGLDKLHGSSR